MIIFLFGIISGLVSGMGMGGGTILILALVFWAHLEQHTAQSANLIFFIPTAVIALTVHARSKNIDYKKGIYLILAGVLGAVLGAQMAAAVPSFALKRLFACFLLVIGGYEIFKK